MTISADTIHKAHELLRKKTKLEAGLASLKAIKVMDGLGAVQITTVDETRRKRIAALDHVFIETEIEAKDVADGLIALMIENVAKKIGAINFDLKTLGVADV